MPRKFNDLAGFRFHKLTVLSRAERPAHVKNSAAYWLCICECGTKIVTQGASLKSGATKSCGCIAGQHQITHGMTKSTEFSSWSAMLGRCLNKNNSAYHNYGGRGITVCERWCSFQAFLADMGLKPTPRHQIDRIDNDLGYSPENCRWATPQENLKNKRSSRLVNYKGRLVTISDAARSIGISPATATSRLQKGIPMDAPVEKAATYSIGGKMLTLIEAGKLLGIAPGTLRSRLARGTPLDAPLKSPTTIDVGGDTLSIKQAAVILGLTENAIKNRIKKGIPLDLPRLRAR